MRRKALPDWSSEELFEHIRVGYDASKAEGPDPYLKSALVFHQNRLKMPRRHVRRALKESEAEGHGFPNFLAVTFYADADLVHRVARFDGDPPSYLVGQVVSFEQEPGARGFIEEWLEGDEYREVTASRLPRLVGRAFFQCMTGRRY
jgi:hypothetical protein